VILRSLAPGRVLKTVERALARQGFAVRPQYRMQSTRQHTERRILAQPIVIVEVLVAQHQAKDPLPNQRLDPVLDVPGIATVGEASDEPTDQTEATIHPSQQQRARVEVMSPPSKPATTARRSTASNSNSVALHSVRIGAHLGSWRKR
jgi:hypothetical protein